MLVSNACGTLIEHCCLSFELRDTSHELVCVMEAFVTRMAKKLRVPGQLFGARSNFTDWNGFVDDKFESAKVDALELVGHGAQSLIELAMLLCFCVSNLTLTPCLQTSANETSQVPARLNWLQNVALGSLTVWSGGMSGCVCS